MKHKILITAVSGTGKSTICKQLSSMGYETYGIEDIEGMFAMYHKGTNDIFTDYDNTDPKKIMNSDWRCDITKLKELLSQQQKELAFYCGVASDMDELIPLFDKVIVIKVSSEILHARLSNREGTEDIGNTEEGRQAVLSWKDWWENMMVEKGALVIDASDKPAAVAQKILAII